MKAITAIGVGVGIACMAIGATMEGSQITAFFNVPAAIIVLGGTFGATLAGAGMDAMKKVPALYKKVLSGDEPDLNGQVRQMVAFAERARREGLLALDDELSEIDDAFTRKGLQLVVDGTDPELVREILENEAEGMAARHAAGVRPFEKAGGFAPTMGILGTVLGLVHVLESLDAPETLGPAISGAFIATLYGVGAANVVLLPIANRLKEMSTAEVELRYLTIEGVLAIQSGDNPRVVADKLSSFIPPAERELEEGAEPGGIDPSVDFEPEAVAA